MARERAIRPKVVHPFNIYADQRDWFRKHPTGQWSNLISDLIDLHIIPLEVDPEDLKLVNNILFLHTEELKMLKDGEALTPHMATKLYSLCRERGIIITAHQAVPIIEQWWRLFK